MEQEFQWLLQEKYNGCETTAYWHDRERLIAGEPLAYVIGHVPFLDTSIELHSRPLIPRSETEYWTAIVIKQLLTNPNKQISVLDLCAGSGCIGIAIAQAVNESQVTFIELDPQHTTTIKNNCINNHIASDRFSIYTGNLLAALPKNLSKPQYDLIVSNPPYIDPAVDRTSPAVRKYEPPIALYGGDHGLTIIRSILETAVQYLTPNGELWIEHEPEQVTALHTITPKPLQLQCTHNDQYKVPRVSVWTMAL